MAKSSPWMRVLCYPLGETSIVTRAGFVRTDLLKNLVRDADPEPPAMRTAPDLTAGGVKLTTPMEALERGILRNVRHLRWWDLSDEVERTEVSGYTVVPALVPRSNRFPEDILLEIVGRRDPLPIEWEALAGSYWETCQPDAEPQTHAVAWRGTDRLEEYLAQTALDLPEGQSFAVRLWWLGTAPVFRTEEPAAIETPAGTVTVDLAEEVSPYAQVVWGGGLWCVNFTLGQAPTLCRWVDGDWRVARRFTAFDTDPFADANPMWLRVFNIAGRLVVQIETAGGDCAQVVYTETLPDRYGQSQVAPVTQARGKVLLGGRGVAFSALLCEYRFGHDVPAETDVWGKVTPAHFDGEGCFSREYWCNRTVNAAAVVAGAFGYYADGNPYRAGSLYEGDASSVAQVEDEPVYEKRGHATVRTGKRRYTCTLSAHNPELTRDMLDEGHSRCMAGARTPFVYGVSVRVGSAKTATSTEPVDIRPALVRASEDLADPMLAAGPMWRFEINRALLGDSIHQGTGNPIGNDWPDYVARNHRLDADLSWTHESGAVNAGEAPYGGSASYVRRLIGFITAEAPEAGGFGDYGATLTARDFSVLLQAPAGVIDARYAPLDLLLHQKLHDGDRTLYGWEGVQYILETAISPEVAAGLVHEFPADHYDLLTHKMLLDPPSGGFFYPPPFGSDARQWLGQLCERDFAVFWWAAQPTDSTTVVPHYCNYYSYLAGAPTMTAYDAVYSGSGTDNLLTAAGWQHDPSSDINRVVVQGAPPGQAGLGGLMPSLGGFSAEARIESGSPISEQNIDDTWERTKLYTGSQFWLPHVARVVALNTLRLLRGVDMRGIRLTVRGNPYLWWGWKVTPRMDAAASDPHGMRLDGQLCRIIRLRNSVDFARGRYETTLNVAPEPNLEG